MTVTVPAVAGVRAPSWRLTRRGEFGAVFGVATLGFFALGLWTLSRHVVYDDAMSRLTHAYMVFWDHPAKLATIGFVWPPGQTLTLLPFVLIKPLATSMVALPLTAALWGGLMVATLNRTLSVLRVPALWRLALLVAWCANPLLLDYATNGMAEIQFMSLMAVGIHYYVVWWIGDGRSYRQISISGVAMAFAFMTRFEVGAWIALMAVGIVVRRWRSRRRASDVEAPVLLFLVPTLYLALIWSVISMQIVGGGPLSWLTRAGDQGLVGARVHGGLASVTHDVISITADVTPALLIIPGLVLLTALWRRDSFGLGLGISAALGTLITLVLMLHTPSFGLLQPRYNFRSLGPLVIAAGWLVTQMPAGWRRGLAGVVAVLALLSGVLTANHLMLHGTQGEERAFERALTTGQDQEGTIAPPNYEIGTANDRWIGHWLDAHTNVRKSVLLDDAAFPGVILTSGRPALFFTLIDHGQGAFQRMAENPWGHFRYTVVGNPDDTSSGFSTDLISEQFPTAYSGKLPGTRVIYRYRFGALLELAPHTPPSYALANALAHRKRIAHLTHR